MHQPLVSLGSASKDQLITQAEQHEHIYVNDVKTTLNVNVCKNIILYSQLSHELTKTGIKEIDEHNSLGGLLPGHIMEFVSLSNVGNTEICFYLIAQYILSNYQRDNNKYVIFITTIGSYSKVRMIEVLRFHSNHQERKPSIPELLEKIKIADCLDLNDLISSVCMLSTIQTDVGLLIIDGMFIHLKDMETSKQYAYKFAVTQNCLKDMKKLGQTRGFPIVVTNNYQIEQNIGKPKLLPYLGERYTQFINCRVHFEDKTNRACFVKLELN